jgi:pimeloyl-ACP methyl ester carboxylesterase
MATRLTHRRVHANGITFHVAVSGPEDAPAVLCLHGFPEGWVSWRATMKQLNGLRVYAPDPRGSGDTDRPPSGYDVLTLTDDVASLIQVLKLDRPLLVGHDWVASSRGSSTTGTPRLAARCSGAHWIGLGISSISKPRELADEIARVAGPRPIAASNGC